jgi:NADH:ubiquinone oxidoreductase subunit B-like Fe-S oxidoreductase
MPEPKFVIAVGSCGTSGGAFHGCYNVVGSIGDVIPVDVYIPGCPPRPEGIIYGVTQLLGKLTNAAKAAPTAAVPAKVPSRRQKQVTGENNEN